MSVFISERIEREAKYVYYNAPVYEMRTGQLLFNNLRHEVADVVRTTNFDPFYEDLSEEEIEEWLASHILYDKQGRMVRLFDGRTVLWEEDPYG